MAQLPLVAHLVDTNITESAGEATNTSQKSSVLQALVDAGIDRGEQQLLLESYLSEQVAGVLRVSQGKLDKEQPLTALGLDSLMAIELRNRIERELQVHISIVAFLQGPSIRQFAIQLLEQLPLAMSPSSVEVAPKDDISIDQQRAAQLLTQLDNLSDEEVELLLGTMLQQENGDTRVRKNGDDEHKRTGEKSQISQQDATQLLAQLDQLSDEDVELLLSQIAQEGNQ